MNNSLPACHGSKKYNQTALPYAKNVCKKYVKLATFWSRNIEKWITLMALKHLERLRQLSHGT